MLGVTSASVGCPVMGRQISTIGQFFKTFNQELESRSPEVSQFADTLSRLKGSVEFPKLKMEHEPFFRLPLDNADLDIAEEVEIAEHDNAEADSDMFSEDVLRSGPLVPIGHAYTSSPSRLARALTRVLSLTPFIGHFFDPDVSTDSDRSILNLLPLGDSRTLKQVRDVDPSFNLAAVTAWAPQFVAQVMQAYYMADVDTLRDTCCDGALSILLAGLKEQHSKSHIVEGRVYGMGQAALASVKTDGDRPHLQMAFPLSEIFHVTDTRGHTLHGSRVGRDRQYVVTVTPDGDQWRRATEGEADGGEIQWRLADIHCEVVDYVANKTDE